MKPGNNAKARVWIVEDSSLEAERARRALEQTHEVEVFADGSTMLEHLVDHRAPDVLVLDWLMPGVSGIEVCRFIRKGISENLQPAILLLTMQRRTDHIVEGLAAGANDYLVKPYADPELLARVEALLRWKTLLGRAQRAEARVLQLLEHAPDPLITIDRQHVITYVNVEAQRLLRQTVRELVGRPITVVLPLLRPEHIDAAAFTSRPMDDIEIGDRVYAPSVRSLPALPALPDSEVPSVTVALRDVTSRRKKESRRLDFYSIIAHDLRSPLAAMLMRTELMLRGHRGVLSTEMIADLRKIDRNMRRLVALINDFLDLARMEEGAHKLDRSPVDLASLMAEVADEFKPLTDNTHQEVRVETEGGVVAVGDRARLRQVFANLFANALKFSPADGHIILSARNIGGWCEVSVEDEGPGVPPDVLPTLFQRYSRVPNVHAHDEGTGLGLLIVREIVEAHGGTVGVDSRSTHGSRFWFRVPSIGQVAVESVPPAARAISP